MTKFTNMQGKVASRSTNGPHVRVPTAVVLAVLGFLAPAPTLAQWTWDGGGADNNWTTANNWSPNSVPTNGPSTDLAFGGATRLTPVVNVPYTIHSLVFNNTAGAFIISGTGLTIGAGGITNNDNTGQRLSLPILLSADQVWETTSNGGLTVQSAATVAGAGFDLMVNDGDLGPNPIEFFGVISGTGTSIICQGSGAVELAGASTYTGGTVVDSGTLRVINTAGSATGAGGVLINTGGALEGDGAIAGSVDNAGHVAPGDTLGTMTLGSSFSQQATGHLDIQIGGATAGQFDQLAVSGVAALGGTLNVSLVNGFVPSPGQQFTIATYASHTGGFATVNLPTISGLCLQLVTGPTNVTLWVSDSGACCPPGGGGSASGPYLEDFNADHTADWVVNDPFATDITVDFFYDYSTIGVPPAPSGTGTRGLKMSCNNIAGVFSGFSVSPAGECFAGDYRVEFDMWLNYAGPLGPGGSGTTQLAMMGIGTAGNVPVWPGSLPKESIMFATTLDGGSFSDYRAYSSVAPSSYPVGNPVYAAPAGQTNNSEGYYTAAFPSQSAPAAQTVLFPGQTGATDHGEASFAWRHVTIEVVDDFATWSIDGLLIATVDLTTIVLGGGNILFGHSDTNATSSIDPNNSLLNVTLIDNVLVTAACDGGDIDRDGDVDLSDYAESPACFTGPGGGVSTLGCGCFDFDLDLDVDLLDFAEFSAAFGD